MAATPKAPRTYTVDQLAAAAHLPTRTLRYWQSLGLIPPPERAGRSVRYGPDHLRRIRLVCAVTERGVRLDAAGELLELIDHGSDSVREWLGLGGEEVGELDPPPSEDPQVHLSTDDLIERLDGQADVIQGLVRMHVVRPTGQGTWVAPSGGLLDLALRIHRLGVDVETAVGAEAILRHHLRQLAEELVAWFEDRLPRARSSRAGWARLGALRPIGVDAVRFILWQELTQAFRRRYRRPASLTSEGELPRWFRWVLGRRTALPPRSPQAGQAAQ